MMMMMMIFVIIIIIIIIIIIRSHAFKFVVPRAKKDIFKFSFFPRTINELNSLPEDIVNSKSVDSFKWKLFSF